MKRPGMRAVVMFFVCLFSCICCTAWGASDGYYTVTEATAVWDGTDADPLKITTTDYDYAYGDEESVTYNLPWNITFYGQNYSRITADTNGNVWFTANNSASSFNLASTGRGPVIAAWNNDLSSSFQGGVFIQHKTNPERIVIEWQAETYTEQGQNIPNNFAVVLFPDGRIRNDYKSFTTLTGDDSGSGTSRGDSSAYLNLTSLYGNAFTLTGRSFQFVPQSLFSVTVTKTGTGGGSISGNPPGISCGASCSSNFAQGAAVTLTAVPDFGSVFDGWSGACSGTGPCTLSVTAVKNVSASFSPTVSPMVAINSPSGVIATHTPQLNYNVSTGTVVVKVDGVLVSQVSGNTLATLADGPHIVRVEATNAGGHMGFAESSFTVDTTPPAVASILPANGSTNEPVRMSVLARFSEPVDPSSITTGRASLTANGVAVPGSFGLSADGSSLIFTPTAKLAYATSFTFTLKAGVRDLAGNSTSSDMVSTFSTPISDPDLVGYWPMDGDWNDYSGRGNNAFGQGSASFANGKDPGVNAGSFVVDSAFYPGSAGVVSSLVSYLFS